MDLELRVEDSYPPTDGMVDEAQRSLNWRKEFGRGGTSIGIARARDIVNRKNLPIDTWRRIKAFFDRHEIDKQAEGFSPGEDGYPSNGRIAWGLWGGDSGYSRSKTIVAMANKDLETKNVPAVTSEAVPPERLNGETIDSEVIVETNSKMSWISDTEFIGSETRRAFINNVELRTNGDKNTLVGYAALFNSDSEDLGGFTESIAPGAFKRTLGMNADVRLLLDHDGMALARTKSGTLMLEEDETGLRVEAMLDNNSPLARSVISAVERRDMDQMSFAFRTISDSWSPDRTSRVLSEVQLFDVSLVTYPAYSETLATIRSRKPGPETEPEIEPETEPEIKIFTKRLQAETDYLELAKNNK